MSTDSKATDPNPAEPQSSASLKTAPHRDEIMRLGRKGLVIMLIIMSIVPVVTVLALWYYLPPVSLNSLEARVELSGIETAQLYDRNDKNSMIPEPKVVVTNEGDEIWTHVIVEINQRYKYYLADRHIAPNESIPIGLNYFTSREGLVYSAAEIPLRHIRVYARLPHGPRATYDLDCEDEVADE